MDLKELRVSRHHSQEELAKITGLNVRTIQRIEGGQQPSLESLKCIASALEIDLSTLRLEKQMSIKKLKIEIIILLIITDLGEGFDILPMKLRSRGFATNYHGNLTG